MLAIHFSTQVNSTADQKAAAPGGRLAGFVNGSRVGLVALPFYQLDCLSAKSVAGLLIVREGLRIVLSVLLTDHRACLLSKSAGLARALLALLVGLLVSTAAFAVILVCSLTCIAGGLTPIRGPGGRVRG